jgi:1,5-anhydro-D-fructose reductase (1,5-anhydro-D-mannitol-forming)
MKKRGLSVGIIGLGRFGQRRLLLLADDARVGTIQFYDPVQTVFAGRRSVTSAAEIIKNPAIGAVFIATPNHLTRALVIAAVRAGKHVFCEKPPGAALADAQAILRAAGRRRNIRVKFGFNHRYLSHYQTLKDYVKNKTYGEVKWARAVYGKGYDQEFYTTWRARKRQSGGGVLIDQGVHMLDLLLDLLGDLTVEGAMAEQLQWTKADVEDNVFALLRSKNGVPVSFHSSMVHWKHLFRLELATTKAVLVMTGVKSSTGSYGDEVLSVYSDWKNNFVDVHTLQRNDPDYYTLRAEITEFLDAITGQGKIIHGSPAEAVRVMKLVDRIYKQSRPRL